MLRTAILTISLFVLWLLLSGIYKPLLIFLGVVSCILTMFIVKRMNLIDRNGISELISIPGLVSYLVWLMKEIAKSNWIVTKVILSPDGKIQQKLFDVPASQTTDIGKVIFANSITLTPGTVTVETEADHFLTHALTKETADIDALAEMDRRVTSMEKLGGAD